MDLHMPEMDGLEATRQIRTWEDNKRHVLVVILTGSVPPQVSDTYKTAGADTFLSKPFDVKRLDSLINLIASEDPDPAQKNANYNMNGSLGELAVLDEQDALVRFDGDATMYCENLSEFIDSLAGRIERVKQSFSLQQWEDLSQQAHNLKGVSANFGAKVLSVLAHRLDEYSHLQKEAETQQTIEAISQHLVILRATAGQILNQKKP
jgi:CheY-like chemotaxis protein